MKKLKQKMGISLVVLVITIIVIIILAAAVILTMGNNNPIESANQATFKNDLDALKNELTLNVANKVLADKGATSLENINQSGIELEGAESLIPSMIGKTVNGVLYTNIFEVQKAKLVYKKGLDENLNQIIDWAKEVGVNEKNEEGSGGEDDSIYIEGVKIPKGFYHVTGTTKAEGLVISDTKDDDVNNSKKGNQFVWIPIANVDEMIDATNPTLTKGKLYTWNKGSVYVDGALNTNSDNKEPIFGTSYDNDITNLSQINTILGTNLQTGEDLKALIQEDLNNIYTSVKKYGGFYIGRFETGDLSKTNVVSKKGNTDISNKTWYTIYAKQKKFATSIEGTNIKSTMIFGCQWDATMKFFANEYVVNAETYNGGKSANLLGGKQPTGNKEAVKNIYDMAGNMHEWTIESFGTRADRCVRGSCFGGFAAGRFAAYKTSSRPTYSGVEVGSRFVIYINDNM